MRRITDAQATLAARAGIEPLKANALNLIVVLILCLDPS